MRYQRHTYAVEVEPKELDLHVNVRVMRRDDGKLFYQLHVLSGAKRQLRLLGYEVDEFVGPESTSSAL